ncbi:hypothetical protein WK25_13935 [Burkholderia latens]|nr:hypothetical protein WK25_13935 [Burkholderia latens]
MLFFRDFRDFVVDVHTEITPTLLEQMSLYIGYLLGFRRYSASSLYEEMRAFDEIKLIDVPIHIGVDPDVSHLQ